MGKGKKLTVKRWLLFAGVFCGCMVSGIVFFKNPGNNTKNSVDNIQSRVTEINAVMEEKSPDLKVTAKNGVVVFADLDAAYSYLLQNDSAGIALIRKEFGLDAPNPENYESYKILGGQVTGGTEEQQQQAAFVSAFFDIYEN